MFSADQYLSWVVTLVGCFGFWLGGKKVWWSWYVNIGNQIFWAAFAIITGYYALLVGVAFYLITFVRNAHLWTKEHFADQKQQLDNLNQMTVADSQVREEVVTADEVREEPAERKTCGHVSNRWHVTCALFPNHFGKHMTALYTWTDAEGIWPIR